MVRDKGGPLSETVTLDGRLIGELLSKRLVLRDLIEDASTVSSKRGRLTGDTVVARALTLLDGTSLSFEGGRS